MGLKLDRKQMYMLTAIILAVTLMLLMAFTDKEEQTPSLPQPEQTPVVYTPAPTAEAQATIAPTNTAESTMVTTVYYQDNYGYLVPVMRSIGAEAGIARASLGLMVKSVYNDMEAARLGLRTVIPEGTTFDLDIADGVARIDLSKEADSCADASSEAIMVNAIVQTLTSFPTVERVQFLLNGKKTAKLKNGTDISASFVSGALNPESEALGEGAQSVMLYFTGDSPSMIVPVTRAVYGKADLSTAILELVKGPSTDSPLDGVIPSGCGLIGVEQKNGVVQINFTQEFIRIAEDSDGGRLAMRALVLTCSQFDGVKKVEILVDGQPYDPGTGTLAMPTFINSANDIADAFIQMRSGELFD